MSVKFIQHKKLNSSELESISMLKDKHWTHGIESQKKWIVNQFLDDDLHVMLSKSDCIAAYVGLNKVECLINGAGTLMWGIGNVCVDKSYQGTGLGVEIMKAVNAYLAGDGQMGILLCHEKLCKFYSKVDWNIVEYKTAFIKDEPFNDFVMAYNIELEPIDKIVFNKNF